MKKRLFVIDDDGLWFYLAENEQTARKEFEKVVDTNYTIIELPLSDEALLQKIVFPEGIALKDLLSQEQTAKNTAYLCMIPSFERLDWIVAQSLPCQFPY